MQNSAASRRRQEAPASQQHLWETRAASSSQPAPQGWWEDAATAVSKGSEYTSWSPPAMFRIYTGSAALSRVQGAEMMCSKPFKVVLRWGLWLLFSALPRECWMRLLVRMLSCLR